MLYALPAVSLILAAVVHAYNTIVCACLVVVVVMVVSVLLSRSFFWSSRVVRLH